MDAERQRQIVRILKSALELDLSERRSYLEKACNGDEMLQREVESILAANDQESNFLEAGAIEDAARMLAEEKAAQDTLIFNSQPAGQSNDTPLRIAPGVILDGRYRIVRELGSGGIGIVYLAQDQKLHGKQVVIKVLQERLGESDQREWFEKKFRDEIKALEQIDHPNVVSALDVGLLPDGRSFLVMQHVSGTTLRAAIPTQGMELSRVGKLVHQIAQGLSAAHGKGVIHRDLKPENIMLTGSGDEEHIKLIDFGMATVREAVSKATSETTKVAGTIRYMAPEQLEGHPVSASDIYALGVITYELITGRQPFDADSAVQLYKQQQAGDLIKPSELRSNLPAGLQDVVLKALSFNALDRYASARVFGEAFNQALAKPDQADPYGTTLIPPVNRQSVSLKRRWSSPTTILITLLIVAALGTIYWLYFSRQLPAETILTAAPATSVTPSLESAAEEGILSFRIWAQKNPKRYPGSKPYLSDGKEVFEEGDLVRMEVSSSQTGFLYVINEEVSTKKLTVLFPITINNRGSAEIRANGFFPLPKIVFTKSKGLERFWLIWSYIPVPELEAIKKWANPDDLGVIRNTIQAISLKEYLEKHSAIKPDTSIDEKNKQKQFKIKGKGEVVVGSIELDRR
jgi:serine/threonine protein kinase